MKSTCSVDGCERKVKARGWCCMHYDRWMKYGDLDAIPRERFPRVPHCTVGDCKRPVEGRGYCQMHWNRWKRSGDPEILQRALPHPACSVDGCENPATSLEWCQAHYARWRRHGDPTHVFVREIKLCSVDGCDRKHYGHGFCALHHDHWAKHGDPLHKRAGKPACSIDGCENPHYGHSWCAMHYQRWKNNGDPLKRIRVQAFPLIIQGDLIMRKCYVCEAIKPNEEYYSFSGFKETSRRMNICKVCQREKQKAYRLAHPEIVKARKKIWYAGARSELIDKRRQVIYGMEKGEYDRMLADQEGKCFLCGTEAQDCPKGTLNVDHNHDTGEVRSLLCSHCNLGLGSLRDDPDLLDKAAAYLRRFDGKGLLGKTG